MAQREQRQYVNYAFYKVEPEWRRLPEGEKEAGKKEFCAVVEKWSQELLIYSYSTVAMRGDCDLLLWRIGYRLEAFQEMSRDLFRTGLGKYVLTPYSYLAMTKRSIYVDHLNPEHEEKRLQIMPGQSRYLFVYPFVKSREWYLMTKSARQGMMDEHIQIGNRFPTVKLNTSYSFGLDDQEFVVAFESDYPEDFLDLVMALREAEGSRFTVRDTPIFTCVRKPIRDALEELG